MGPGHKKLLSTSIAKEKWMLLLYWCRMFCHGWEALKAMSTADTESFLECWTRGPFAKKKEG